MPPIFSHKPACFIIAGREWRNQFYSPLAWSMLALVQGVLAWIFIVLIEDFRAMEGRLLNLEPAPGVTDLIAAPLLQVSAWVLLLLIPLLTMRLFSAERRSGTLDLLLSAPLATWHIVLGKYLGVLAFLLLVIALIALMPLSLALDATLDYGKLAAGFCGLSLLAAAATAAAVYVALLSTQPALVASISLALLLALWMLDAWNNSAIYSYLALRRHYQNFLLGWFNSADLAYYLLFSAAFLGLAVRRLDNLRLQD